ncbi:MAG: phage holin family protein [Ruminococcaceae bacterium]|nr:phage holin family protein [Oscillospiraceae bacterium]
MKAADKIKFCFVTVFTAVNGFLGSLAIPFYILVGANVVDYITGIAAAVYRGERVNSEVGFHGIAKKVCMWLLVMIGFVLDYCLVEMGHTMHIDVGMDCLVSVAVVFWLLVNELISILENINDIGTPLPPFLMKLVEYVREKTEESADVNSEG